MLPVRPLVRLEAPVTGEYVAVWHLVQVRPLVVDSVLVVVMVRVHLMTVLVVPRLWFESGYHSRSS